MAIVITVGKLGFGGVEIRTLEVLKYLFDKGELSPSDVIIYIVSGLKGRLDSTYSDLGVHLVYGRPGALGWLYFFRFLLRVKPIVLHVNASYASGIYCFAGFLAGIKVRVSHLRSSDFPEGVNRAKYLLYIPMLSAFSTMVVGVSESCQKLGRVPDQKWCLLYDAVSDPGDLIDNLIGGDVDNCALGIVMIGRVESCKNVDFALEVCSSVKMGFQRPFRLTVIGEVGEAEKNRLMNKAVSLSIDKDVVFLGALDRSKAMNELVKNDLLLLTSSREGLPGVVIESSAVGVPAIVSDLPGCLEIARYLKGIKLKSLSQQPDEWAQEIIELSKVKVDDARESFLKSPFVLSVHAEKLLDVWMFAEGKR